MGPSTVIVAANLSKGATMGLFNRSRTRSADQIASGFGQLIEEGREMLGEVAKRPAAAKASLRDALDDVSDKLAGYKTSATRIARRGARRGTKYVRRADDYVHDNPWPAIAGGIALGALASLWLSQRR
jgi:ElaB/YqjD/DUF883 family membrane-anchored ribosome-binding protein